MINELESPKTTKKSKIVGRGRGSGKGAHTTGRGTKGQRSRSGYRRPGRAFEGGQLPLTRRLPHLKGMVAGKNTRKRGFITSKLINRPIKLSRLAEKIENDAVVNFDKLIDLKFIKAKSHKSVEVKIVFDKDIDKKFTVEGVNVTEKAKSAIEKAGGKIN